MSNKYEQLMEEVLKRVYCKDKKVPLSFNHIYKDGMLCLATDADQLCFFADGHMLLPLFFVQNQPISFVHRLPELLPAESFCCSQPAFFFLTSKILVL